MISSIILKISRGDLKRSFDVSLENNQENQGTIITRASLPPVLSLRNAYTAWEEQFQPGNFTRLKSKISKASDSNNLHKELLKGFEDWLSAKSFTHIKYVLRSILQQKQETLIFLEADYPLLWKLPWQSWSTLNENPKTECVLKFPNSHIFDYPSIVNPRKKIRILVILGDRSNIDIETDLAILNKLPQEKFEIRFPGSREKNQQSSTSVSRCQIYDSLWDEKGWDILFFAGHSSTLWEQNQDGQLQINEEEYLTTFEVRQALRYAVTLGLKLAIFNSCDGLGLASGLSQLGIAQTIVMRHPVPDEVAQIFLQEFLSEFIQGNSVEYALHLARKKLAEKSAIFAGLPVLCGVPQKELINLSSLGSDNLKPVNWESLGRALTTINASQRLRQNLFVEKRGFEIEDIYIPIRLEKLPTSQLPDQTSSNSYRKAENNQETRTYDQDEFLDQVVGSYRREPSYFSKRIAIVGEPGSGKSLFLQRFGELLAWNSAYQNTLVIQISLADVTPGKTLEKSLLSIWLNKVKKYFYCSETIPTSLQERLQAGHVWFLLDAVDEMPVRSGNPLVYLVDQLERSNIFASANIVLTCRNYIWEPSREALRDFSIYRLCPLTYASRKDSTSDQVEKFILRWFASDRRQGDKLRQLLDDPDKRLIKQIVTNPLCLSLLCTVWQEPTNSFPETRTELYEQYVETIIDWKKHRFSTESGLIAWNRPSFNLSKDETANELKQRLAKLARKCLSSNSYFHLYVKWLRKLQDKETKYPLLVKYFKGFSNFQAKLNDGINHITASAYLGEYLPLALETGLLTLSNNQNGRKVYAFFHSTFHTYFASLAFKFSDSDQFLLHDNLRLLHPAYGRYLVFYPKWQEVILFWIGRKGDETDNSFKVRFLQRLLNFEDGCLGFYSFQAQFLAAIALTEFGNCPDQLAKGIIGKIIDLSVPYFNSDEDFRLPYQAVQDRAENVLLHSRREYTIPLVQEALKDIHSFGFRLNAAILLNQLDPGHPDAISTFVEWMRVAKDDWDGRNCEQILMDSAYGNLEAINFSESAFNSLDDSILWKARFALLLIILAWNIPSTSEKKYTEQVEVAIKYLLEQLESSHDTDLLFYLPDYFEQIVIYHPTTVPKLISELTRILRIFSQVNSVLLDDLEEERLMRTSESILKLEPTHKDSMIALAEIALYTRSRFHERGKLAINTLERLAGGHLNLTYQRPPKNSRMGAVSQSLYHSLYVVMRDIDTQSLGENKSAWFQLLGLLSEVSPLGDVPVIQLMVSSLTQEVDPSYQLKTVECLGKISPQHPSIHETIQIFEKQGCSDALIDAPRREVYQFIPLRKQAIETLIKINPRSDSSIEKLIQYLRELCQNWQKGFELLDCSLEEADQKLKDYLNRFKYLELSDEELSILRLTDASQSQINPLVEQLANVGVGHPEAIAICQWMLTLQLPCYTQVLSAKTLGFLRPGDKVAIKTLLELCVISESAISALLDLARKKSIYQTAEQRVEIISALSYLVRTAPTATERFKSAKALSEFDLGNDLAISTFLELLNYGSPHPSQVVEALKITLQGENVKYNCRRILSKISPNLLDIRIQDHEKFERLLEICWHCAEQLDYKEFFQVWNRQSSLRFLHPQFLNRRVLRFWLDLQFAIQYYTSHPIYLLLNITRLIFAIFSWLFKIAGISLFLAVYPLFLITKSVSYLSKKWWGFDLVATVLNFTASVIGYVLAICLAVLILTLPVVLVFMFINWVFSR